MKTFTPHHSVALRVAQSRRALALPFLFALPSAARAQWQTFDTTPPGNSQAWVFYDSRYPTPPFTYGGAWNVANNWPGTGAGVTIRHSIDLNNNPWRYLPPNNTPQYPFPGGTVNPDGSNRGLLTVNVLNIQPGGSLASALEDFSFDGVSTWSGGLIRAGGSSPPGVVHNRGQLSVTGPFTLGSGGAGMLNTEHISIASTLNMEFGSQLTNLSGTLPDPFVAEVVLAGPASAIVQGSGGGGPGGFISNYGVLRKTGSGTVTIGVGLENYADSTANRAGTVAVDGGTLIMEPSARTSHLSGLKAEVAPSALLILRRNHVFNTGTTTVTGGGVLRLESVSGSYFSPASGAIATLAALEGKLECNGAEMRDLTNTGSINVTAGSTWNGMVNKGHVRLLANLQRAGTPISNGTATSHSAIMDLEDTAGFPIAGTALNNYALLRKNGPGVSTIDTGTLNVYGAANAADSGAIEVTGGTLRFPSVFLYFLNGGRIRVANGAALELLHTTSINGGGTLTVTGSGKVRLQPGATLSTTTPTTPGTFDAAPGTFEFNGGAVNGPMTNAGELFIAAPTNWGYSFLGSNSVINNGTIRMTATSAATGNSLNLTALVYLENRAAGTLAFDIAGRPGQTTQWARLIHGGQSNVTYGGKLRINFGNFTPVSGDRWLVVNNAGGIPNGGDFAAVEFANVPAGFTPTFEKINAGIRVGLDAAPAPQTYAQWATAQNFANVPAADFTADPDGDGWSNGLEAALGTNPKSITSKPAGQTISYNSGGDRFLAVQYTRPGGASRLTDVQYIPERSDDLASWTTSGALLESGPLNAQGQETITVRLAEPFDYHQRGLLRLRVQR